MVMDERRRRTVLADSIVNVCSIDSTTTTSTTAAIATIVLLLVVVIGNRSVGIVTQSSSAQSGPNG